MGTRTCELCGKECTEFGDLGGAIICGDCLGWYTTDIDFPAAKILNKVLEELGNDL